MVDLAIWWMVIREFRAIDLIDFVCMNESLLEVSQCQRSKTS